MENKYKILLKTLTKHFLASCEYRRLEDEKNRALLNNDYKLATELKAKQELIGINTPTIEGITNQLKDLDSK